MPRNRATLEGAKPFIRRLERLSEGSQDKLRKAVRGGAEIIEGDAKRGISRGARTGTVYKRGKSGKVHVASSPGELPKTDTGELVANITVEEVPGSKGFAYTVGSREQAPHGYYLETKHPAHGGRPWLGPTVKKDADKVFKKISDALKEAWRNGGK